MSYTETRTHAEHMRWCKERAIFELDRGSTSNALASLISDLGKHDETSGMVEFAAMIGLVHLGDRDGMRRFIDGFAE